jgi:hypothetical protein
VSSPRPTAIDVLVPTYGRPEQLRHALASVEAVQAAEAGLDLRIQVLDEEHGSGQGPAIARNLAAEAGSAEFIALLDDDDRWVAPRLAAAIEVLRARPEVALVAGDAALASGGRFLAPRSGATGRDLGHRELLLDCAVCTSTVTLRRNDWERAGGMDPGLARAEDYELWLRLTRDGRRVHLLPGILARYDDVGGLSGDGPAMAAATLLALERSGRIRPGDRAVRDRRGRLRAVVAHGEAKAGRRREARRLAARSVLEAPGARVAWTALARALLRGRV